MQAACRPAAQLLQVVACRQAGRQAGRLIAPSCEHPNTPLTPPSLPASPAVPGLDDLLMGINSEEGEEALLGDLFAAQQPSLASPWTTTDPFAHAAPGHHQRQQHLQLQALQHPVSVASAALAPSARHHLALLHQRQQLTQQPGALLVDTTFSSIHQMHNAVALQQQHQQQQQPLQPRLVPQLAPMQNAGHAVPLGMDRSGSADTRRSYNSLNLLPGAAAHKPAATAGRRGAASDGRKAGKRKAAAAAAAPVVLGTARQLAAASPVLPLQQDQQAQQAVAVQHQAMQAMHAQQQQHHHHQQQQQQQALQQALRQRVLQAHQAQQQALQQQAQQQQQQQPAAVAAGSLCNRELHFMPTAVTAVPSRVASGSGPAQLPAQQQQQQQQLPAAALPAAPERPAVRWLLHDPSALQPVKRGASVVALVDWLPHQNPHMCPPVCCEGSQPGCLCVGGRLINYCLSPVCLTPSQCWLQRRCPSPNALSWMLQRCSCLQQPRWWRRVRRTPPLRCWTPPLGPPLAPICPCCAACLVHTAPGNYQHAWLIGGWPLSPPLND